MGLIQRPDASGARTEELPPEEVLEMDEKTWYVKAYRGEDAPQLTVRALAMGSLLDTVPISSGLIAGESIVGVIVAILNNFVIR